MKATYSFTDIDNLRNKKAGQTDAITGKYSITGSMTRMLSLVYNMNTAWRWFLKESDIGETTISLGRSRRE